MTKRIIMILLATLAISVQAFSQTTVKGSVFDTKGEAIPGVNVLVKGTTTGTMTDLDGKYQLAGANANTVLVFSCIGYEAQEVAVAGRTTIDVVLAEDSEMLEETVVVAYGTAKKKDLTGSIATVNNETLSAQAQGSVSRMLEGQVAGLQTTAVDGQPGLDMGIRIRGIGTASANNANALIIIDGAPAIEGTNPLSSINSKDIESITVLKDAASTALYGSRGANGVILVTTKNGKSGKAKVSFEGRWGVNTVSDLANGRVENIGDNCIGDLYETYWLGIYNAVYTGYDATAAGLGLVGNASKAAEFASQHLFNYAGKANNCTTWNGLYNRLAYKVPGMTYTPTGSGSNASSTLGGSYLVGTDGRLNPNAEVLYHGAALQDELLTPRFRQEYNASVSGGTEKIDYHMSLGYLSDPSYVSVSGFDRYTARASVNAQVTNWLKAGSKFAFTHRTTNSNPRRWGRNPGSVGENPFSRVNSSTALDQAYARDLDGKWIYKDGIRLGNCNSGANNVFQATPTLSPLGPTRNLFSQATNWVEFYQNQIDRNVNDDLNAHGYLRASFLKHFTAEVNITYNTTFNTHEMFADDQTMNFRTSGVGGSAIHKDKEQYTALTSQQLLNYGQNFGKHHVDATLGHEFWMYNYEKMAYGSAFALIHDFEGYSNFLGTRSYGPFGGSNSGSLDKQALESYLGRANYNFDETYYLSASLRRDGTSKFKDPALRWGTFWSIGAGWRISSEPWMDGAKGWLDNLKVRASYGVLGNQNGVRNYSGYQTWSYGASGWSGSGNSTYPTGITLSKGPWTNGGLSWENVKTTDAGIDFTLFGGKLAGTFDWFNKQTDNAVWAQQVSLLAAGQAALDMNTAGIRSRGVEIELSYQPVKTKDWDVILSVNGTHYNNILTSVPDGTGSELLGGCWEAGSEAWSLGGDTGGGNNGYLRGVGKDYYNMYLYHFAGVAGNSGITYYGNDGKQYTGYTNGDPYAGMPLFTHVVTDAEAKAGTFGSAKAGDWINTTNDGIASKVELGDALPEWYGGFNANVRYKGLDLGVQLSYQIGGKFFSREYWGGGDEGRYYASMMSDGVGLSSELFRSTWTPDNPDAKFPMLIANETANRTGATIGTGGADNATDMALFDASYLSVKNITLGYTFPQKWMDKAKIANLRIYVSADNPVLIYGHKGVDPRWNMVGSLTVGPFSYAYLTTYNFGVNIDF